MIRSAFQLARFVVFVSWKRSLFALLLLIVSSFTEGISLVMLLPVLNMLKSEQGITTIAVPLEKLGFPKGQVFNAELWEVLVVFVFAVCVSGLVNRTRTLHMTTLVYDCINSMRFRVFSSIAEARWDFVADQRISDLDHVLTGDIDRVQVSIANLFTILQSVVFITAYIILSALISPLLTAVACVLGGTAVLVMQPIRRHSTYYGNQLTADRQTQYRIVSDFLIGLKTTKSFAAEHVYISQLKGILDGMRSRGNEFARIVANTALTFQFISAALASIFVYIAYAILSVDLTSIILLLVIYLRLSPRLSSLQSGLQSFAINVSAFEALDKMHAKASAAKERNSEQTTAIEDVGVISVEFRDVGFTRADDQVLENVSFSLQLGRVTAIVGPSGSGKSTIADILMGLLQPTTGEVLVNQRRLSALTVNAWRGRNVAYVSQEIYLLSATLAENLQIALPGADPDAMWEALRQAQADHFVRKLSDGLNTRVGEGGIKFSGGERQRLALARALLRKPKVLILDEPTSALDAQNTELLVETLKKLKKDMAVLIITHSGDVAELADQTISLAAGKSVIDDRNSI